MVIEDAILAFGVGGAASPFEETGALVRCPNHPEIWIRVGDQAKEKAAFELADTRLRAHPADERQASKDAMAACLNSATNRLCPLCLASSAVDGRTHGLSPALATPRGLLGSGLSGSAGGA